ncbi:MAG: hypothetical protein ACI4M6_00580 [Christensenellaceae bacterium]
MSIRKCPRCGLPVANIKICPNCGTDVDAWYSRTYNFNNNDANVNGFHSANAQNVSNKPKKNYVVFNHLRMTPWEVAFILICNMAFVLTLINVLIGGPCWCHYPVLAMYVAYFFSFACASGSLKKFLTRYRNAVFITNIIAGVYNVIYNSLSVGNINWVLDYFVPVNLIIACTVMLSMLFVPTVSMRNVLFSTLILMIQSVIQFILMAVGLTGHSGRVSHILISVAFGVNVMTVLNIAFLYVIKARNMVVDQFRLWE